MENPSYINLSAWQVDCSACYLLHAGSLSDLFFDLEDGSDMFFQNVG
jgi:hypothetical protein